LQDPERRGHRDGRLQANKHVKQAHQSARIRYTLRSGFHIVKTTGGTLRGIKLSRPFVILCSHLRTAAGSAAMLGRFDEALRLKRRAFDLDPLNADSCESLAETEFFMGQLDQAAADFKKALKLNSDVVAAHMVLSQIYVLLGRPQDALPEIELVRYPSIRPYLYAIAYYALGRQKESDTALSEFIAKNHTSMAYQIAEVYAFRNQLDEAFEWLERAYAQRDSGLIFTKVDPLLNNLHGDPRFAAFLKKLNLPT